MSQSTFIAGVLVAAFLLFLAVRGRLNVYGNALFGASAPDPSSGGSSGGGFSLGSVAGGIAKDAGTAALAGLF